MIKTDYIAFYDLDHTVLEGNSATYLVQEALKIGLMSDAQYRHAVWISILYKLNLGDPVKMIDRMLGWLKGKTVSEVNNIAAEIFNKNIKTQIRPEILNSIKEHREKKGKIVLLSSATTPICDPVVKHLKMDDIICSELEEEEGILTGTTKGKLVYGMEKKVRMLEYCDLQDANPEKAWYYGDSHTDEHVMRAVGNPVAVAPDKKLLKIADSLKWPILVKRS